ncbi:hypothetical protein [Thermocrinis jamiesonii]|jgi:hypothetical protein|uniref:hypothetical protein n=1 Tax=Thermocrinis jamiesonii TaxID=1302351 RepID=UPI0004957F73|nr:hypothetical protein [Thermocrinis jamiesonii]
MKVLLILYRSLLNKKDLIKDLEDQVNLLSRVIGPDSIYAVITSEMKDLFDKFPELVFINNEKGSFIYGLYKGLRKLRGNHVLVIDPVEKLTKEKLGKLLSAGKKNIISKGVALLKLMDLDYVIRTVEKYRNAEANIEDILNEVYQEYGIKYEIL